VETVSSNNADVRDFLVSRRARITPQQAGLQFYGGNRRVPGLRREEVAMMAGVSADYYTRLEKGNLTGVSDSVLEAIAGALQLSEAERLHLFDLARTANTSPARAAQRRPPPEVRPGIRLILDGMTDTPAFVRNTAWTSSPSTPSAAPCTHPFSPIRAARPTWPGSISSTPLPATSTSASTTPPAPPSNCCAPRQAATRSTPP